MSIEIILNKIKKIIPRQFLVLSLPPYHFILNWLAALIYRWPSEKLIVIGVTGTTGKTSTVYLLARILSSAGFKVGYTSTAMFNDGKQEWLNDKKMTMAGRFFTQKMLARMCRNHCQYAIVETTSEGIAQFRHRFINYDILVFTGLYPEHIESHGSFTNYRLAKGRLFSHLRQGKSKYVDEHQQVVSASGFKKIDLNKVKKTIVVNANDESAEYFSSFWAEEKIGFVTENKDSCLDDEKIKIITATNILSEKSGVSFKVKEQIIKLNLWGEFNVINAMAALIVAYSRGVTLSVIKQGLEKIKGIPGRLEEVAIGQSFKIIVDYAFEPGAITSLYKAVSLIPHKKIIHLLGSAGGGRDKSRRSVLGRLAAQQADYVVITNEDPYDEDPEKIIAAVAAGALAAGKKENDNLFIISDRRQAIAKALALACRDDIVLLTGKGSEQAICLAEGKKEKWDDRQIVREELAKMLKR